MLSIIKHRPQRYAAFAAAALAITVGSLAATTAAAAHAPARADDLRASTTLNTTSTNGGAVSTLGGPTSPSGPASRFQKGTPPGRIVVPTNDPCLFSNCIYASWQYNAYGRGTITVSGSGLGFRGGDTVNVAITGPTNSFEGSTTASGPATFGTFSIPDVGVECNSFSDTVTATDPQTGASAVTSVTMPCQ